ncbi:DNA/RNA non-specific endonuclease [Nostoc sp. 106C]|uniref:DNA/RNA non-specific endonuclease n=1 Tax=Nostoc sp. 106C TaxID=1932667 RepID=UPI000A3A401C|nr:DNA/RNA non-specific endonuclease [Nostoc sp. 106C]OUL33739.1 hypothetical protein BV375_06780 [Nostoc sp. 106C]
MANDLNHFPLQSAIKKILDDPNSRPALPDLGDGISVGDDNFGKADRYDTGVSPSVALNNGNVVVEVHKSQSRDRLFYRVGKVESDKIDWGKYENNKSIDYDDGVQPSVAITNDGLVVEVHKSQTYDRLYYRVGKVKGDEIDWGKYENNKSIDYDDGVQPSVAITNDGLVVEVHKSQTYDRLYYRVGKVKGDEIDWGKYENNKSIDYDDGVQPSVAITNDGLVVEVHKSQTYDRLYYRVGKVKGDEIDWGKYENNKSIDYDDGVQPSVAITNDGLVVEVHKSQNHDTLWYQVGRIDNETITGFDYGNSQSKKYSSNGTVPKVAGNGVLAVETHQEGEDQLWSSILTLPAFRPQWLEDRGPNSYCYFSMGTGFGPGSNERIATSKTITVDPGAPFLLANITQSRESITFPSGAAMLTIQAPDGTVYNQEESGGGNIVSKSGASLQSLVIKEPIAGNYHITLTLPPNVAFFFTFETLPSKDIVDTIQGSQSLQKRASPGGKVEVVASPIASIWLNVAATQPQNLTFLEEPTGYLTGSSLSVLHTPTPTTVTVAVQTITQNIQWPPDINAFITPPATPTPAPINGPVLQFVRNPAGALLWLRAQITPNNLGTGTGTNDATRAFAQRLGLRSDDAGHVIGNRLGGLGTVEWNIFPQNPNFNRGAYSSYVEQVLADAVRRYGSIEVWFRFHYDNPLLPNRPDRFDFIYRLPGPNGQYRYNDLLNPEHVPRGA